MSDSQQGGENWDQLETTDVTEVHASVEREHSEPRSDNMPIPTWLGVICAASLCWAGAYIGMFHGGFSSKIYNEFTSTPGDFFPLKGGGQKGGAPAEELTLLALGEKVFSNCLPCHGANGQGVAPNPPLAGSEWVAGSESSDKRLLAILLKGLKGPITVKGQTHNGPMPAWGQALKPRQLAAVATFIRQSWGNQGSEINEAQVVAAKKAFAEQTSEWTIEQIKAIPLSEHLEGGTEAPAPEPTAGANPPASASSEPSSSSYDLAASVEKGKPIYEATCNACHQATGLGLPGAFPPLVATEWVTGDPRRLVAIVLKGIAGAMTVDGKIYVTGMPSPAATFPHLKDDKNLADVLNYVRNSFGNKSNIPITPEFVGKIRAEFASDTAPFSEETLKNLK